MPSKVSTHLMFEGDAEEAINFYVSIFGNSKIIEVEKYQAEEQGAEGTIKQASFTLAGQKFICIDSPISHEFSFTPSMSIFVDCSSEMVLQEAFDQLSANGKIWMPLDNYGFNAKFAWVSDRFGVSWQLNLP